LQLKDPMSPLQINVRLKLNGHPNSIQETSGMAENTLRGIKQEPQWHAMVAHAQEYASREKLFQELNWVLAPTESMAQLDENEQMLFLRTSQQYTIKSLHSEFIIDIEDPEKLVGATVSYGASYMSIRTYDNSPGSSSEGFLHETSSHLDGVGIDPQT